MKRINKLFPVIFARALRSLLVLCGLCAVLFAFAACSNDDSSSGGGEDTSRKITVAVVLPASGEQNTRGAGQALFDRSGLLCLVDSRDTVPYERFVAMLEEFAPRHALYMDMGAGWNHSWWRDADGKVHEIHPVAEKSRYCTNWITFYR